MSFVVNFMRTAVLALGAVIFANNANALPVTWNLTAAFDDGVTANGSYTFDADTTTFSNISITTTLSETLTFENAQFASGGDFLFFVADEFGTNGTPAYSFSLAASMTNDGGLISILTSVFSGGTGASFGGLCTGDVPCEGIDILRNLVSGSVTTVAAVPLPAGGVLLLTALGGFGLLRRFRSAA